MRQNTFAAGAIPERNWGANSALLAPYSWIWKKENEWRMEKRKGVIEGKGGKVKGRGGKGEGRK